MEIVTIEQLSKRNDPCAVAIGYFDGLHIGHQAVIKKAIDYKRKNKQAASVVITFDRSPKVATKRTLDEGDLMTPAAKIQFLADMGVDYLLVLTFDTTLLNLSADDFIKQYLINIHAQFVAVGFDFKFGQGKKGDAAKLMACGHFQVAICEPIMKDGHKVATRAIKTFLKSNDFHAAKASLGRPFSINGQVIYGNQIGRTIGFPTANLKIEKEQFFPFQGVFTTVATVDGITYKSMTNVGTNPTVCDNGGQSIETHLLSFDGDLYGKQIQLTFMHKIREEVKFDSLEKLLLQLELDKKMTEAMVLDS